MWMQIARGLRKNVFYSISGVIMTVVTLVLNILLIAVYKLQVQGLIISNIIAAICVIIYLELALRISSFFEFGIKGNDYRQKLIIYSLPLIPNMLSWWFMNVSDRYILNFFMGIEANGIYAVANKFPSLLLMVNSIFNLAWQESAIVEYESEDRNEFYSKTLGILINLQFTVVFVLLSCTKLIMHYVVDPKFYQSWKYIPFLYFGAVFSTFCSFYGTGYQSTKKTLGAFYTSVLGAALNIIINLLTVPYIGIQGASLSTMLAFLVVWLSRIIEMRKYFSIKIHKLNLLILLIISVMFIWLYYIELTYLSIIGFVFSLIIFIIFNKKLLYKGVINIIHVAK
jgi:O-antigen/teichoic acid export membrane protein